LYVVVQLLFIFLFIFFVVIWIGSQGQARQEAGQSVVVCDFVELLPKSLNAQASNTWVRFNRVLLAG
jgi:hypothetical protein